MKSRMVEILVAAVVLFVGASPVMATIYFNDGGVHDIDYIINDDVFVDYQSPGMGTTVNIIEGGRPEAIKGFEDSIINMLGGGIKYELYAHDNSRVTVSGGSMRGIWAGENSQVTVSGGWIKENLRADVGSEITVSGGSIRYLKAYDGQVTISGGAITSLEVFSDSQVALSGGTIEGYIELGAKGILTIDGSDFAVDGEPVGYTEIRTVYGLGDAFQSYRRLTGTLLSGEAINNDFRIRHSAKIVLVPEPATIFLFGFGSLVLFRKTNSQS